MRCLVTGGAGFIGSTLVDELLKRGHEVSVIDNESSESHEHFYKNSKAYYHRTDICDYESVLKIFSAYLNCHIGPFDCVFHLAAESRIQPTLEDPQRACQVNFLGTCNILQAARETGVKRVIYSSTSSAYGMRGAPHVEYMSRDCLNPYSVTKVAAEDLCKMYYTLFGLETIIFRYFNVYGPREPTKGIYAPVIGRFLRLKEEGKPLTIIGNGLQKRDYTHVDDVVAANTLAMTTQNKNALGLVLNIGSGTNHSVLEVAKMISNNFIFLESRKGEAKETLADISRATNLLGWKPNNNLEKYIELTMNKE